MKSFIAFFIEKRTAPKSHASVRFSIPKDARLRFAFNLKLCASFVILFTLFSQLVSSQATLNFTEGDFISLRPVASDSDGDKLTYYFRPPLSMKGEWQTTYGDAGVYDTQLVVSDGRLLVSQNITLNIFKKEEAPEVQVVSPEKNEFYLTEGKTALFTFRASDKKNKDSVTLFWFFDGNQVAEGSYYLFEPDYYSQGNHNIKAVANDGFVNTTQDWNVEVGDVDRKALLDNFKSVTMNETQLLALSLPDFKAYGLQYIISEPVGADGLWQTTYDDAGVYEIAITIYDGIEFNETKEIKVLVENVDRAPVFNGESAASVYENNQVILPVSFEDFDGDKVEVNAWNIPDGATFNGTAIVWTPGFDFVTKNTTMDEIARRYHALNKELLFNMTATSQDLETMQQFSVRVFNANRPPIIRSVQDITVNEGNPIIVAFDAYDPDGDELTYALGGYITKNEQAASEPGTHIITLSVTDGLAIVERQVQVDVSPSEERVSLESLPLLSIEESKTLSVELKAKNADSFSVEPLPEGAAIVGNYFIWTPTQNAVTEDTLMNLTFTATGKSGEDSQSTVLVVKNVNTPPQILESSQIDGKEFSVGERIMFGAEATDIDGDNLSYSWVSESKQLDETGNTVSLAFDKPGKKTAVLRVSDGKKTATRSWTISVVKRPEITLYKVQQVSKPITQTQTASVKQQVITAALPVHDPEYIRFYVEHHGDQPVAPVNSGLSFVIG